MKNISLKTSFADTKAAILEGSPWYVAGYPAQTDIILGLGWTWVQSQPIMSFKKKNSYHFITIQRRDKDLKNNCKAYIKENYKENSVKTSLIGGIILNFVLNMIINWIVNKLINSLTNEE